MRTLELENLLVRTIIKKDYNLSMQAYQHYLKVSKDPNMIDYLDRITRYLKDFVKVDLRAYLIHTSLIRATLLQRIGNKIRGVKMK